MPYAVNDGVRIHYEVEGLGPPLVLQHGTMMSLQFWYVNRYVEKLSDSYRLILIDGRGHGASDKPHEPAAYDLAARVGDVVAVLDEIEIPRTHYMGYSMGGWIGFGLAQHARDRVTSLILGGAHAFAESAEAFAGVDGRDEDAFVAAVERFVGFSMTSEFRERILKNDLRALAASLAKPRASLEGTLADMTMPCLLYAGEKDPRYEGIRFCSARMPNATLFTINGANHAQTNPQSDLVVPKVLEFLAKNGA